MVAPSDGEECDIDIGKNARLRFFDRYFLPFHSTTLPADRAEAKSRSDAIGKLRSCKSRSSS